jgi:hypothetical protein
MSRGPSDPLDTVLTPDLLAAMAEAYCRPFAVPAQPDTPRRHWHPGSFLRTKKPVRFAKVAGSWLRNGLDATKRSQVTCMDRGGGCHRLGHDGSVSLMWWQRDKAARPGAVQPAAGARATVVAGAGR